MASASAVPFLAGKTRRIDEGAIGFVAIEKTFFEEAVEGGHDRGVGERTAELGDNIADAACSAGPENFHQFEFETAESQGLAGVGATSDAVFEEADHCLLSIGPMPETREIVSPLSGSEKRKSGKRPNETAFRSKDRSANTRFCMVRRAGRLGGYTRAERK